MSSINVKNDSIWRWLKSGGGGGITYAVASAP